MTDAYKLNGQKWQNRIVGYDNVAPDQLLANPMNFRLHPKGQQDALVGSLNEIGWVQDVIVNRVTGHVLDGHLRVQLALRNNEPTVPVKYIELDESSERLALAIFDPITYMAETDTEILDALLREVNTGEEALQELLAGMAEEAGLYGDAPSEVQDVAPQIDRASELQSRWQTAQGQIWQLGDHRLACGDCTGGAIVDALLDGETPNLIIADPPYGVSIVATNVSVGGGEGPNGMIPFGGVKSKRLGSVGGAKPFGREPIRGSVGASNIVDVGKYAPIIGDETTETALRSLAFYLERYPKAVQVWWGANYYVDGLTPSACWLVWDKETTGNFADCELAWTNQDKAAKLFRHQWNGMLRDSERERRWHPTQKPAALAAWVFNEFTQEGDVVIDPFGGAGWALLGGEQAGRKVRVIEMSEEYVAIMLQRWADATGREPVRVG